MKRKIVCRGCGRDYWASLVKVYVFKRRLCSKCKGGLVRVPRTNYLRCQKCKIAWNLDDKADVARLGVKMMGTSRDFKVAEAMRKRGIEVVKMVLPEKQTCQRCRNMQNMIANVTRKQRKERSGKIVTKEQIAASMRRALQQKVAQHLRETQAAEKRKMQIELQQRKLKKKVSKKPDKPVLLTTPFNVDKKELTEEDEDRLADKARKQQKKQRVVSKYKPSRRGKG